MNDADLQDRIKAAIKQGQAWLAERDRTHMERTTSAPILAAAVGCLAPRIDVAEMLAAAYRDLAPRTQTATGIVSADRMLGRLALALQKPDDAITHFEDGLEFCRKAGYRPELAWTCSDYSEMLLDRNESGDREKASELQDEAIAIATELGMKPLLERVLAQREILKA